MGGIAAELKSGGVACESMYYHIDVLYRERHVSWQWLPYACFYLLWPLQAFSFVLVVSKLANQLPAIMSRRLCRKLFCLGEPIRNLSCMASVLQ